MKKFTWDDLAEEISKLSERQRKLPVLSSVDDESRFRRVVSIQMVPEDVYVNKDDEDDCGSLQDLKDAWGEDFERSDYKKSTSKGTLFLWDGF